MRTRPATSSSTATWRSGRCLATLRGTANRRNGRWKRDSNLRQMSQIDGWRKLMKKAGLGLHVAARATLADEFGQRRP